MLTRACFFVSLVAATLAASQTTSRADTCYFVAENGHFHRIGPDGEDQHVLNEIGAYLGDGFFTAENGHLHQLGPDDGDEHIIDAIAEYIGNGLFRALNGHLHRSGQTVRTSTSPTA